METQRKIKTEIPEEEEYQELEMTPELEKYLLGVMRGEDVVDEVYTTTAELWESIFGPSWKEHFKNADAAENNTI